MEPVKNYTIVNGQVVAACDIKQGDLIMVEKPLTCGPGRQGYPVCMACFQFVDGSYFCSRCGWQLCSEACESGEFHQLDCPVLAEKEIACDIYDFDDRTLSMEFMGPLRLALAIKEHKDQALVRSLLKIETHNEKRKGKYSHKFFIGCEDMILKSLRDACKVEGFTDDELLTIIGLFEMYGLPIGPSGAKAFHLGPCFMKSSCKPNSYSMLLSDYSIMYKASVPISKGQLITRSYGDVTKCTFFRRQEIEDQFMFLCECERCTDPSEFGTKFGGIHCPGCKEGIAIPTNPLDIESSSPWKCDNCGKESSGKECADKIKFLNGNIQGSIADSRGSIQVYEFMLNTKGDWSAAPLSGQMMMDVKKQYLINLGTVPGNLYDQLDKEKLEKKLELCKENLKMIQTFHPGFNYLRVAIIYEAVETCRSLLSRNMGSDIIKNDLKKWCAEAGQILRIEEEGSPYQNLNSYLSGIAESC